MSGKAILFGLWAASLSSSVIILTVLLLRMLFQSRTPRRVFCLLWDVALLRLLIPNTLPCPWSVWRWLTPSVPAQGAAIRLSDPQAVTAVPTAGTMIANAAVQADRAVLPVQAPDRTMLLTAGWLTVGLILLVWFLWSHLRFRRACADSLPCGDSFVQGWLAAHPLRRPVRVRTSDRIAAPLTYGVLRPVILLPSEMNWTDRAALSCILEHEFGHIRRFDTLRKALLAAALCLHWFNPLVWVMYRLSNRDMELNCDEAVTARCADRAKYAQTLLDMEEQRASWGLSGSHFSQNALEERIRCMMKHRKTSIAALIAVLLVMSMTVTAFATSAPQDKAESQSGQDAPRTGYVYNHFQATEGETIIRDQGDVRQYSLDGGETWLSEEDYRAQYGESDYQVEWWTAEEYVAWLEEEKQVLQSIIGERGYTGGEGWFTWDQARVDEAVALYERILMDIQSGALYSKSITDRNGNALEEVALASWTLAEGNSFSVTEEDMAVSEHVDEEELMEELKAFGIERNGNQLTYKGQPVRHLVDGAAIGKDGYAIWYDYADPNGVVDVHTLRTVIHHPDGSYDFRGALMGLVTEGENGYDQKLIDSTASLDVAQAAVDEIMADEADEIAAVLEPYKAFGLSYRYEQNQHGETQLRMSWNGKPVHSLYDAEMGIWVANNMNGTDLPGDAVDLETVYQAGILSGLREIVSSANAQMAYAQGGDGSGTTFEEIFAQYQPYGLICTRGEDGAYRLMWNGQAVASFADVRPDGGAFSYQVPGAEDGLQLYTEYDADGQLTGLRAE